ncbi:MAG: 50S ribosomal protein L22 [Candidatus Peribacteria bacterium]|nr:MAG: 50S ribosomal protein L22 [Candidatus Peribacteria bacterium]
MTATLKNAESSDKKIALVAKMIRGKDVLEARNILRFMPKKAANILLKVVDSAAANAENNADQKVNNLYIQTVEVGQATKLKRMRFVGRSRVHRYIKHRANITVILATK